MQRFTFFRPFDSIEKSQRLLPHWEQPDVCYLLTFRTIDSVPAKVMERWQEERRQWLRSHSIDSDAETGDVHVLVQQLGMHGIGKTCYSWKKFAARKIHEKLGRGGHFWQAETYDHVVRSEVQFQHYRTYLADNPVRAKLGPGEYTLYLPELG